MDGKGRFVKIIFIIVAALFMLSWLIKSDFGRSFAQPDWLSVRDAFFTTLAAFLTLSVMSFLYKDNPYYKFAEHLFVGVSAAYWMSVAFWSTIVGNLFPRISPELSHYFGVPFKGFDIFYFLPVVLGIMLLLRLSSKAGWISRWPLAFIVGTTAGLNLIRYLRSDFISQVSNTFVPLLVEWKGVGSFFSGFSLAASGQFALSLSNLVIFIGVFCGLIYFFFSKEHKGFFGGASRMGIWVLMITFGASFGYTVMGRISLLVGRLTFLFHDWLGLIR
ncbi:MAG: hypothetical protein NTV06_00270 [candidate division Zixibacteria bacterium]|nr:hypothetical protein [candidate division Zixibacteria bacterium]